MLPSHLILAYVASRCYRGKCIKMHQHTLETPLKVSQICFVLQYWQVATISSIFIVEMTWRRLKVIYYYAYHQDLYTYSSMIPCIDLNTSNVIKILLSGNAQKQEIEEILKVVSRVCPTRSPGKETGSHFSAWIHVCLYPKILRKWWVSYCFTKLFPDQ